MTRPSDRPRGCLPQITRLCPDCQIVLQPAQRRKRPTLRRSTRKGPNHWPTAPPSTLLSLERRAGSSYRLNPGASYHTQHGLSNVVQVRRPSPLALAPASPPTQSLPQEAATLLPSCPVQRDQPRDRGTTHSDEQARPDPQDVAERQGSGDGKDRTCRRVQDPWPARPPRQGPGRSPIGKEDPVPRLAWGDYRLAPLPPDNDHRAACTVKYAHRPPPPGASHRLPPGAATAATAPHTPAPNYE